MVFLLLVAGAAPVQARQKIALVLGGGGARGAAHAGVLKVLKKENIPIDMIVGTSMGAVVGGYYAAGVDPEKIAETFMCGRMMRKFVPVPVTVRVISAPFILIAPRLVYHPYDGLYYGWRFRKYLESLMPDGKSDLKIEELKIPFAAVGVDLSTGETRAITEGKLSLAMQGSSAIPGLRKPVQMGEHLYIDGGTLSNIPIQQAKELGADKIIAVNIDERFEKLPLEHFRKMGSVSKRVVVLQIREMESTHLGKADVLIEPDVTGIKLLSTKAADAKRAFSEGEKAAIVALPAIRKCLSGAAQ
jgi:Predicted esterase of the alpha-beta hydrolase superfamily